MTRTYSFDAAASTQNLKSPSTFFPATRDTWNNQNTLAREAQPRHSIGESRCSEEAGQQAYHQLTHTVRDGSKLNRDCAVQELCLDSSPRRRKKLAGGAGLYGMRRPHVQTFFEVLP